MAPDGRAFYSGPDQTMRELNTNGTGAVADLRPARRINRDYGSHALYDVGKILVAGGGGSSADARVIDINGATPQVTATAPMANGRRQHNLTVLADGTVLATGGNSSGAGLVDLNNGVYAAELWNPGDRHVEDARRRAGDAPVPLHRAAAARRPRAVLGRRHLRHVRPGRLPRQERAGLHAAVPVQDRRLRRARAAPDDRLGARRASPTARAFQIDTPDAAAIRKVALVRLGAVTHSVNMEQRYVPLTFTAGAGALTATAPANANVAPPGVYMLFIIDASGVPSVAKMVTVGARPPTRRRRPRRRADGDRGDGTQVNLSWTAATDNVGVTGYRVERCQGPAAPTSPRSPRHGTTYSDTGLSASTTYRYRVRAADAAGNLGGTPPVAEATTGAAPPAPTGLVGAWAFSEGTGTTTADASGNGNAGTITGATWSTQGRYGNALSFNGTNSVVRVAERAVAEPRLGDDPVGVDPADRHPERLADHHPAPGRRLLPHRQRRLAAAPGGRRTLGGSIQYLGGPTANPVNAWTHVAADLRRRHPAALRQRRPGRHARGRPAPSRPPPTRSGSAATSPTASTSRGSSTRPASTTGRSPQPRSRPT